MSAAEATATHHILLVDDDRAFRLSTAELLRLDGHRVTMAEAAPEAERLLERDTFDLLILDLRMPGLSGVRFLEVLRTRGVRIPVLMLTGFGTVDAAVESMQIGADDFLTKPVDPEVLTTRVAALLNRRPPESDAEAGARGLVGRSAGMRSVYEQIRRVAPTDTTVLVTGETGTGKELVARAIHAASERAAGPFVPVNCAALAEGILESELFGHVRGAFTGALHDRPGLFRAADGGTLFLDEVGDMSLRLQQRLLRVLQERDVVPVGAVAPVHVDVRVIAATHRDLRAETEADRFRSDLLYRLRVFEIMLPPLRDRASDIPLLIEAALARIASRSSRPVPVHVSPLAMRMLRAYPWPGNVRELFSVLESAAIRTDAASVQAQDLPDEVRAAGARAGGPRSRSPDADAADPNGIDEKAELEAALREADGVRSRAAEILGISRTTLWRRMRDLEVDEGATDA